MRRRVLVIDDDPGTVSTFAVILRLNGFEVATAQTGADGLVLLQSESYDVVLADLRLPDMTGVDVLRELRSIQQLGVSFIIMTAFATTVSTVEAMKLGARDYVEKPLSEVDVIDIVQRAIDCRSEPTPSEASATDWRVFQVGLIRFSGQFRCADRSSSSCLLSLKRMTGVGPVGNRVLCGFP